MEMIPRSTRSQKMDALSSQASLAGYQAVILAADRLPKIFPMMMTPAGTISPSRVFVIGAGVAGLQAITKAGDEDGNALMGGSCIIAPTGEIVALCRTLKDELRRKQTDVDQNEASQTFRITRCIRSCLWRSNPIHVR